MKKIVVALVIAVMTAGVAFAQNGPAPAAQNPKTTAAPTAPAAQATLTVTGTIQKIVKANATKKTSEQIVVRVDGKDVTFIVLGTTEIKDATGKAAKFSALTKGAKVTVLYTVTAQGNEAKSIGITK